jgi:hypothetical protein
MLRVDLVVVAQALWLFVQMLHPALLILVVVVVELPQLTVHKGFPLAAAQVVQV